MTFDLDATYPGTDMVMRLCYAADCQKPILTLDDMWVDVDSNCVVCTSCRDLAAQSGYYTSLEEWQDAILPASALLAADVNEMEQG